jgi:hypothetical protein
MSKTTRSGILGRGLLFLGGLGAAGAGKLAFDRSHSLVLSGSNWRGYDGELPHEGERVTVRGDLHAYANGAPVGEFLATAIAFGGASHPALVERKETHTFKLHDGSIFGTGIAGGLDGSFAVLGGTGRYAGVQGTYTARQGHAELGGDGTAEFVFDLLT